MIPAVNDDLCDYCGKCASACKYNALVVLPKQVMAVSRMRLHGKNEFSAMLLSQKRIMDVIRHFGFAATVCINKYDIYVKNSKTITGFCLQRGVAVVG